MLRATIDLAASDDEDESLASAFIFNSGWKCQVRFYPLFFKRSLEEQLAVVVHEHIHLMTHPLEQALGRFERTLSPKRQDEMGDALTVAREIMVDHATMPIYKLLEPSILKVL